MDTVRMGYVGCGFMAQAVHIPNILSLDACELAAIAEVRTKLGQRVQRRHGIARLYPSHRELAEDKDIDAAAVSGHFAGQGQIAIDLLEAGKHVFMEKPMAVTVEQAERILQAERASGKRLMVGYMKRYDPGNLLVKQTLEGLRASGEMGPIRFVRNHGFCGDWLAGIDVPIEKTDEPYPAGPEMWPQWCAQPFRRGYIGYLQQYTHNVNLVRWFLEAGADVKVKAVELDPSDGVAGVVVLEAAGILCTIESGSVPYHGWDEHTQIYFDRGWIRTQAPPLLLKNVPATVEIYRAEKEAKVESRTFPAGGRAWSYKEEMRHFVACVRTGAEFRSPAADAIEDVRLLEEIYRRFVEQQP